MQDAWLCPKAEEIQTYADSKNTKCLYSALKQVYVPQHSGISSLLTEKEQHSLQRRKKYSAAIMHK